MTGRSRALGACFAAIAGAALIALPAAPAHALGFPHFGHAKPDAKQQADLKSLLDSVDQALREQRLVDAGRMLDEAYMAQITDKRLVLRSGELLLMRQRYEDAVRSFGEAAEEPSLRAQALQGKGIALAKLGRAADATAALKAAVQADPSLWRAWDALAVQSDRRHDFVESEADYAHALKANDVQAYVYNNRGYSRLLQGRYEEASADFVKALQMQPDLAPARTNLRLSLALRGKYREATAMSGAEDRGAVLNNAGFAAVLRGDLGQAENLFQEAVDARGQTYGRALENLKMVKALRSSKEPEAPAPPKPAS